MIPASRQRSYLQSALYVAIAGILAAVLLERLLTYAEAHEKAKVEMTLSRLHSALYTRVAYWALRGEYDRIEALAVQSPFAQTRFNPPNYLGEFDGPPEDAAAGSWYFDRLQRELVYLPNLRRHLIGLPERGPVTSLRYRVEVLKVSRYAYTGVALRPVGQNQWEPVP